LAKSTEASMRSSFYSTKFDDTNQGERKIVESFKLSNILELSEQEIYIVSEIKRIMNEECE
jgi:hypothetical protein